MGLAKVSGKIRNSIENNKYRIFIAKKRKFNFFLFIFVQVEEYNASIYLLGSCEREETFPRFKIPKFDNKFHFKVFSAQNHKYCH